MNKGLPCPSTRNRSHTDDHDISPNPIFAHALNRSPDEDLHTVSFFLGQFVFSGDTEKGSSKERILYGTDAAVGQFPFMALTIIQRESPNKPNAKTLCGGVLISDSWVLSAAHCLMGAKPPIKLTLGLTNRDDRSGHLHYLIPESSIFMRSDFRLSDPPRGDVVLYKLPTPVVFEEHPNIRTIGLAKLPPDSVSKFDDSVATTLGWGVTESGKGSNVLKFTTIKIMENDKCISRFPGTTKAFICSEKYTQFSGPCPGDSGGPLIAKGSRGVDELIGITSHTKGDEPCLDPLSAIMYTYIPFYLDWIEDVTANN